MRKCIYSAVVDLSFAPQVKFLYRQTIWYRIFGFIDIVSVRSVGTNCAAEEDFCKS